MSRNGPANTFMNLHDEADAALLEVTNQNPFPVKIMGDLDGRTVEGFLGKYIVTQAPFLLKTNAGILHSVTLNTPVASAVISIYDDISAVAANLIAVFTLPAALLNSGPSTALLDIRFSRGLTVVTSGANGVWTVAYL